MTRIIHAVPALALTLFAGACSSFEERYHAALPVDQRLPIEVSAQVSLLDVETDGRGALTPRSQSEVAGFLRAYKQDGSGQVEIQTAGANVMAAEAQIRDYASIYGIPRDKIAIHSYAPRPGSRSKIRVVASVPACENPDWSQNLSTTPDNTTYPTFGCAVQQNIAAMASNPLDTQQARPFDPATAERRGAVIGKYRTAESPSTARTEGDSGKINDTPSGTERK